MEAYFGNESILKSFISINMQIQLESVFNIFSNFSAGGGSLQFVAYKLVNFKKNSVEIILGLHKTGWIWKPSNMKGDIN